MNQYFQFKQFTIQQQKCAMKVCTDACVFGAWVAQLESKRSNQQTGNALDIGTGTGLLSLMLAQQTAYNIQAIDIDEQATVQAKENFLSSPWSNRLTALQQDFLQYHAVDTFDVVLSNPPFYEKDLRSPNKQINLARHDTGLTLLQLMQGVYNTLSDDGRFYLLMPFNRHQEILSASAAVGLYCSELVAVKATDQHPVFRKMYQFFKYDRHAFQSKQLSIKQEQNYTSEATALLQPYYLFL
ncbi:MAG: hypothetical protein RLY16_1238 [Bacteroidota bacterium]